MTDLRKALKGVVSWEDEWTIVTEWLRKCAKNLAIPIVPPSDSQQAHVPDQVAALARLVEEHYGGKGSYVRKFSEDIVIKYATVSEKLNGNIKWSREEMAKVCEILGINPEDQCRYFEKLMESNHSSPTTSLALRKRIENHYGSHGVKKLGMELKLPDNTVRTMLRGARRWGEYKQQVCKILDIEPEEEAELFCDEKV
jgi:hypothetical protein